MKKVIMVSLAVFLVLTGYVSLAQAEDFLRVKGIYWDSRLDGDIAASTELVPGTELDLSSTLDLDESTYIPEIELKINVPMMGKIIGSYWQAKYEGEKTLTQDIDFAGTTFTTSEDVQTDLNLTMVSLLYEMTFAPEFITRAFPSIAEAEAGLLLGLKYLQAQVELSSAATESIDEEFGAPIPVVGIFLRLGILKQVELEVSAVGFSADISDISVKFTDLYAEAKINLIKGVPLGLGYKSTGFNVKDGDTFEVNLGMEGLYFFTTLEF